MRRISRREFLRSSGVGLGALGAGALGGCAAPVTGDVAPKSGRRVVVIDDNVDAAESLSMLLRLGGHQVRMAHDGPAALEAAVSFLPEMVLLDIYYVENWNLFFDLGILLRSIPAILRAKGAY